MFIIPLYSRYIVSFWWGRLNGGSGSSSGCWRNNGECVALYVGSCTVQFHFLLSSLCVSLYFCVYACHSVWSVNFFPPPFYALDWRTNKITKVKGHKKSRLSFCMSEWDIGVTKQWLNWSNGEKVVLGGRGGPPECWEARVVVMFSVSPSRPHHYSS